MATRFYFRDTTAAEPKPNVKQAATTITQWLVSTLGGGQDGSSTAYPCEMLTAPGASNATIGGSVTETGAAHYAWVKQFISPALVAQTISGTFSLVCDFNESNALHNMNPHIFIYVWKADDSGSRGTLYAAATSTLEADTTNGSLQTFTFASYTLSSLAISAGDRIVVELMAYDNNTKTSAYSHIVGLNGAAASGYESYIEFSTTIAFPATSYQVNKDSDARVRITSSTSKDAAGRIRKVGSTSKGAAAAVRKTMSGAKDSSARVRKVGSASEQSAARVRRNYSATKDSTACVRGTVSVQKLSNARVKWTFSAEIGSGAWVRRLGGTEMPSGARVHAIQQKTKDSSARVLKPSTIEKGSDAKVGSGTISESFEMPSDTRVSVEQYVQVYSGAHVARRGSIQVSSGACVVEAPTFDAPKVYFMTYRCHECEHFLKMYPKVTMLVLDAKTTHILQKETLALNGLEE
jgi:hypothetical protein